MHISSSETSVSGLVSGCAIGELTPVPLLTDRVWGTVAETQRAVLIKAAEAAQDAGWPDLPLSLFQRFTRDGNRVAFEDAYFGRRKKLSALVLGEAMERRGRFIGDIRQGVALICAEPVWQLPAHNREVRGGPISPDPVRPIIDLFAAETAAQLAVVSALFGAELDQPIEQNIRDRVLSPYLEREFWWMGESGGRMNNWTVWCTQNVLIAALSLPLSAPERTRIVARAAGSRDAFLAEYGEDGACPEGAYYYGHAALCLYTALDLLNRVSEGAVEPLFRTAKLRNIAEYILYPHISDDHYANFGDAAARMAGPDHRVAQFAAAVGSRSLGGFASRFARGDDPDAFSLYDRINGLFCTSDDVLYQPVEGYLPSIGMFVARDDRFYVAANAGHNGADHNHNDVGNLIVYKDGAPVLIDVGVETYCAKTFSPDRYDIWTMRSSYHNLPEVGGAMQEAGADRAARDVVAEHGESTAQLEMEIAGAYPASAGLVRYHRRVTLERGCAVNIADWFEADKPVVLNLMVAQEPQRTGDTLCIGAAEIRLTGVAHIETEEIPVTDPKLSQSWSGPIYRLRLTPVADRINMVIS